MPHAASVSTTRMRNAIMDRWRTSDRVVAATPSEEATASLLGVDPPSNPVQEGQ